MVMPELVDAGGGGERKKEFDEEMTGGDNEGAEEGASCHAADVSKPKGSITMVPKKGRIQVKKPLFPQGDVHKYRSQVTENNAINLNAIT
jgi:hypothetical protein